MDGRLSCDEFVLAMHLCDMARAGEKIPDVLPPELKPPQMRRSSVVSAAAQVTSPLTANAATPTEILIGLASSPSPVDQEGKVLSPVSFEDKRKENFDKGKLPYLL